MTIKTNDDLRIAYSILHAITDSSNERLAEHAKRLKREIRSYQPDSRNIVRDGGIDGYVELLEFPESFDGHTKDEIECYFESNNWIHAPNTCYDCTGCAFTSRVKVFNRRGHWLAYHFVNYDV